MFLFQPPPSAVSAMPPPALVLLLFLLTAARGQEEKNNKKECVVTPEDEWHSSYLGLAGWSCVREGRERCLPAHWWCDGDGDCDGGEDERCTEEEEDTREEDTGEDDRDEGDDDCGDREDERCNGGSSGRLGSVEIFEPRRRFDPYGNVFNTRRKI